MCADFKDHLKKVGIIYRSKSIIPNSWDYKYIFNRGFTQIYADKKDFLPGRHAQAKTSYALRA